MELGRKPDNSHRAGEIVKLPNGRERIWRRGLWAVQAVRVEPGDLNAQIEGLLTGLSEDLAVWRRLTSTYRADVFCGLFLKERNEGLTISPDILTRLGERGVRLDLDIYAGDE